MIQGQCKLCLQQANLISKSHIIPFSYIKKLRDKDNRFIIAKTESWENPSWKQNFFYESSILCKNCDNELISGFERELANFDRILHERAAKGFDIGSHIVRPPTHKLVSDYPKLKLAILSIVWRAHVSQNPFFKGIDIGSHAEKIRNYLLSKSPGVDIDIRISAFGLLAQFNKIIGIITQPVMAHGDGLNYVVLILNGIVFNVELEFNKYNKVFNQSLLANGEITVIFMPPDMTFPYLNTFYKTDKFTQG
jgi:hypothetical protein